MAKKTRRVRLSAAQRYVPTPGALDAETDAPIAQPAARMSPAGIKQNPGVEYAHIRGDLTRMGILAGSILAVLVALRLLVFR